MSIVSEDTLIESSLRGLDYSCSYFLFYHPLCYCKSNRIIENKYLTVFNCCIEMMTFTINYCSTFILSFTYSGGVLYFGCKRKCSCTNQNFSWSVPYACLNYYKTFHKFVRTCTNICLWWFDFRQNPIFTTALAASKNDTPFKSGQKRLENNHPALLI